MAEPLMNYTSPPKVSGSETKISNVGQSIIKITQFDGYNGREDLSPYESPEMINFSSDSYPYIKTRPHRELIKSISNPHNIFASKKICGVIGTSFYWDGWEVGNIKGSVTDSDKCLVDFNGYILIFPDKKYYNYIDDEFGDMTITIDDVAIDIDYAIEYGNRVWGVKGSSIYASKWGDFNTWDDYSGEANDSYATDVYSQGDFVGITKYLSHLQLWKIDRMYELYGDRPSNYNLIETFNVGAINNTAFAELNSCLFFLANDGIKYYAGEFPVDVSYKLNKNYVGGAAVSDGTKYYISLYNGSTYDLMVYDPRYKIWHREDNIQIESFCRYEGYVYAMATNGIYKFNSGADTFASVYTSKIFEEEPFYDKVNTKLRIQYRSSGTQVVYISYDGGEFEAIETFTDASNTKKNRIINLENRSANTVQIKITSTGELTLYQIDRIFEIKNEYKRY